MRVSFEVIASLSGDVCAICFDGFSEDDRSIGHTQQTLEGRVNHIFHEHCIAPWLSENRRCPTCLAQVRPSIFSCLKTSLATGVGIAGVTLATIGAASLPIIVAGGPYRDAAIAAAAGAVFIEATPAVASLTIEAGLAATGAVGGLGSVRRAASGVLAAGIAATIPVEVNARVIAGTLAGIAGVAVTLGLGGTEQIEKDLLLGLVGSAAFLGSNSRCSSGVAGVMAGILIGAATGSSDIPQMGLISCTTVLFARLASLAMAIALGADPQYLHTGLRAGGVAALGLGMYGLLEGAPEIYATAAVVSGIAAGGLAFYRSFF